MFSHKTVLHNIPEIWVQDQRNVFSGMNLSPDSDFFRNVGLDALEQHFAADRPDRPGMTERSTMDAGASWMP